MSTTTTSHSASLDNSYPPNLLCFRFAAWKLVGVKHLLVGNQRQKSGDSSGLKPDIVLFGVWFPGIKHCFPKRIPHPACNLSSTHVASVDLSKEQKSETTHIHGMTSQFASRNQFPKE